MPSSRGRFRPKLPLAPVVVGANNSGRDLAGQQFHKAPLIGVGGAVRIETRDEKSEG